MKLTKEEQKMFPKVMTERHFKNGSDVSKSWNFKYAFETTVNNPIDEARFYEGLNPEANIVIEVKLPNGVRMGFRQK